MSQTKGAVAPPLSLSPSTHPSTAARHAQILTATNSIHWYTCPHTAPMHLHTCPHTSSMAEQIVRRTKSKQSQTSCPALPVCWGTVVCHGVSAVVTVASLTASFIEQHERANQDVAYEFDAVVNWTVARVKQHELRGGDRGQGGKGWGQDSSGTAARSDDLPLEPTLPRYVGCDRGKRPLSFHTHPSRHDGWG